MLSLATVEVGPSESHPNGGAFVGLEYDLELPTYNIGKLGSLGFSPSGYNLIWLNWFDGGVFKTNLNTDSNEYAVASGSSGLYIQYVLTSDLSSLGVTVPPLDVLWYTAGTTASIRLIPIPVTGVPNVPSFPLYL